MPALPNIPILPVPKQALSVDFVKVLQDEKKEKKTFSATRLWHQL